MKKNVISIVLLLLVQQVSALTFFDQLCAFNPNWKNYAGRLPMEQARVFNSDKDYVQAHLGSVLNILRTNPTSHLDAAQYRSRLQLIKVLDGYRRAGNFPINYYRYERIPVFIDPNNTYCAVGYLLKQTGHDAAALRIAATNNYIWVKDINDASLLQWQQSSGFSLEELKLIQGVYDYYRPDAFVVPNKYEIPQKPACITAYFEKTKKNGRKRKTTFIWCYGEGENGVLNGRWEQNYAIGIPWIVGYFDKGKRTGQWMEYYQGTSILCRTENWSNDKLNGVRKRFDRAGNLIEEIFFKDGNAVTKTNYDLRQQLTWVRTPLDSTKVWTEVFTTGGVMLAKGHEKVYNPGNLLWFQNIELTALNSAAITSKEISQSKDFFAGKAPRSLRSFGHPALYNTPPLVEYKKEGEWMYYRNFLTENVLAQSSGSLQSFLTNSYRQFGAIIYQAVQPFQDIKVTYAYDSIKVVYANNLLQDFYGYGLGDYVHLHLGYHSIALNGMPPELPYRIGGRTYSQQPVSLIKEAGQYNRDNEKIGTWKHFNKNGQLYKTENYLLPQNDDDLNGANSLLQPEAIWRQEELIRMRGRF
jgi:hypothetical protein